MAKPDPKLKTETDTIERDLFRVSSTFQAAGDFRWFFSFAHASITRFILRNIELFDDPNQLLRLNRHFATEYLDAARGRPHEVWKKAFKYCEALQTNAAINPALVGEVEFCGASMAKVHIKYDLSNALKAEGCLNARDYGNMLTLVLRGNLAAEMKLRGMFGAANVLLLGKLFGPKLNLDVEEWRNAAYTQVCRLPVPKPDRAFTSQVR